MIRRIVYIWALCVPALLWAGGCGSNQAEPPPGAPTEMPTLSVEMPTDSEVAPAQEDATENNGSETSPAEDTPVTDNSTEEDPTEESSAAAQWGDLFGRFVYDGTVPEPEPINVNRDQEHFANLNLVDESLVVAENGGLANVVVYVRTSGVAVHPDYDKTDDDMIFLDNKGGRFEPHVAGLRLTQKLIVRNPDPVSHNTNITPLGETGINPILAVGGETEHAFGRQQNIPVPVACNVHPWMKAYVLPRANPYFAVSAEDGSFKIAKVPAGAELEIQLWHEKSGYLKNVELADGELQASERGRFTLTLQVGANDLGTIRVDPQIFEK